MDGPPTPELDELALAMATWLEAADRRASDPAASRRALDEVRRRLALLAELRRGTAPGRG